MSAQQVIRSGRELDASVVKEFAAQLRDELIRPGDDTYDRAPSIFNAMIDKRPALIARCTGVADVTSAVNFARTPRLLVAIRVGGHNVAGNALCGDGLMIDLSRM